MGALRQGRRASRSLIAGLVTLTLLVGACGSAEDPEPTQTPSAPVSASRTTGPTSASPTRPAVTSTSPTTTPPTTTAPRTTPPGTTPPKTTTTKPKPTTTKPQPTTTTPKPPACNLAPYRGMDVERLATSKKEVALTFDGGGSSAGARKILDTLAAKDVPATFFFTGQFAQSYPSLAAEIATKYPVGNHTQTHPDLTTLSRTQVVDEIRKGRATIKAVTGAETRPLFRFPFGARNSTVIGLVNDECYVAYRWTVDTLGWQGTSGGRSVDSVHARVMSTLQPGQIVLMHIGAHPQDGSTLDADALGRIIDSVRAQGYRFVTLPR